MSQRDKPRQGVVANILNLFRNRASLLANPFGVGFTDWLGDIRFHSGRGPHEMRSQIATYSNDWPPDTSGGVDNNSREPSNLK